MKCIAVYLGHNDFDTCRDRAVLKMFGVHRRLSQWILRDENDFVEKFASGLVVFEFRDTLSCLNRISFAHVNFLWHCLISMMPASAVRISISETWLFETAFAAEVESTRSSFEYENKKRQRLFGSEELAHFALNIIDCSFSQAY